MGKSLTGGVVAFALLLVSAILVTGPMGLNMWNAKPTTVSGTVVNTPESCPESTASYTFYAYNELKQSTGVTGNLKLQVFSEGSNKWLTVNSSSGANLGNSVSKSLIVGKKYRVAVWNDNGSTDYYMVTKDIDSAICGGDVLYIYPYKEGDLELTWIESDQTGSGNEINDGIIVKGESQDFHATLKLEENASNAVFGDGVTPIGVALEYNTSSYDGVSVAGATKGNLPDYLSSSYQRFYILPFNQIGEFESKEITIVGDVAEGNDPDGLNFNITATLVDGDGFFNGDTGALEYGYEDEDNNNIGVTSDPSATLVVR